MSQTFYATFQNGKVVLDEPNPKIPEGKRLKLVVPDNDTELEDEDSMDNDERARLHATLDEGLAQIAQGQTLPAQEVLAKLKNRA